MPSLFRPEVVEARQQAWLGGIQLIRPLSLSFLTACAVVAALLVVGYLFFGEYTRKARVGGVLVPDLGVIRLMPPEPATVLERLANEGQAVKRGQLLFVLSADRATAGGDAQASVQRSLALTERSLQDALQRQSLLLDTRRTALDRQIADRRGELAQIETESTLHRERLDLAQQALAQYESLHRDNFISFAQLRAKGEEALAVRAQLQALQRQRAAQQREIGVLEGERRELPLQAQAARGELERDLATVAREATQTEARRRILVHAPSDGVLGAVLAEPGQPVTPAAALASLVPADARLQAHLYAPSSALGFVRPEQAVLLRYQAYPYQKFGHQTGQVLQVSRTPLQAAEMAGVPLAGVAAFSDVSGEPLYRITVALDRQTVAAYGQPQALVAGMQLEADVQLDRRRLIEWLFEPLLGLTRRVAAEPT
ncbi:HlyD family efflux transporter periplasmic adaptor subunit [Methylibium sp.]|uniref:HlyD family secretion protein n=1 Tax=Methylibium sp. TaxID=2067992 RepID=UPI0017AB22AC|nr:HlyD family efflux transporter periplasmic adaptor subunit [Methylibium sp.]MBA3589591.1 HlyD family efflux transporter periplasmic adaptor subunit [Methylibium sp.]